MLVKNTVPNLDSLFSLNTYVEIFVPSTVNVNEKNDSLCEGILMDVRKKLASTFGGCTCYRTVGDYIANDGTLVSEDITIVRSWCDGVDDNKIDVVVRLAQHVKDILRQESVAIVIGQKRIVDEVEYPVESKMYFV